MGFLGLSDADQAFPRLGQQLPDILGRVFITKTDAQGGVQFLRRQAQRGEHRTLFAAGTGGTAGNIDTPLSQKVQQRLAAVSRQGNIENVRHTGRGFMDPHISQVDGAAPGTALLALPEAEALRQQRRKRR